jgi:Cu-processing system permease protein
VDKTITKIRALTFNTLQEVLRRRVLYVVAIALVLTCAIIFSQLKVMQMASSAGESTERMTAGFVQQALGVWNFTAGALALFLGAVGISSEIVAKTIAHVVSRPVERAVYLMGRWLGTLIFLWGFQLLGILLALLITRIFDVRFTSMFWAGCTEMFVAPLFLSGVSLGLSVLLPPALAGGCAWLLSFASVFIGDTLHHPIWALRQLANLAFYLLPARMPQDLIAESFQKELLRPDFPLYFRVMGENVLYAVVVFIAAAAIFRRRELRLR